MKVWCRLVLFFIKRDLLLPIRWIGTSMVIIGMSFLLATQQSQGFPSKEQTGEGGYRKGKIENYQTGSLNYVRALAVEEQFLWVGTSGGVLQIQRHTGELIHTYTRKEGLRNEYVFAIGIDPQGVKWFGTNGGGMTRFDGKNWKTYFPMHGLADYWVYAFAFARDGSMWIGTWDGVNWFDGKEFITYKEKDGLINIWCYGIAIDEKGAVWFGTEGGVSRFDGKTWKSWTHSDGLGAPNVQKLRASSNTGLGTKDRQNLNVLDPGGAETYNPNYVFAVLIDQQHYKWFGTWGAGASRFDGEHWVNFTTADGLAGNIVYAIAMEKDGVLWFGTNHGVSRYDGKNFVNYNRTDGLLGEDVYAIAIDQDNVKWFGQKGGVTKLID